MPQNEQHNHQQHRIAHPISKKLKKWYDTHKRNLPWRETNDPYTIWISEVILQQTRVDQGLDYFYRFTSRFPDVQSLAAANEETVLKLWQGLGYYSRARNLHTAAKQVIEQFCAKFPDNYTDLLKLKGVGEYTAAAVASIAFGEAHAVVDGNVYRVLSRLFAIDAPIDTSEGKKKIAHLANEVLDFENPGLHNQAMMEFGALHCTPNTPNCTGCPLQEQCMAFAMQRTNDFPVKKRKTKVRNRYFHYFHIVENGHTYIHKRDKQDVWKNLYEFPLIETDKPRAFHQLMHDEKFQSLFLPKAHTLFYEKLTLKHVLSHQIIHAKFYFVQTQTSILISKHNQLKIKNEDVVKYPVSRLIHKYLETISDETLLF